MFSIMLRIIPKREKKTMQMWRPLRVHWGQLNLVSILSKNHFVLCGYTDVSSAPKYAFIAGKIAYKYGTFLLGH